MSRCERVAAQVGRGGGMSMRGQEGFLFDWIRMNSGFETVANVGRMGSDPAVTEWPVGTSLFPRRLAQALAATSWSTPPSAPCSGESVRPTP